MSPPPPQAPPISLFVATPAYNNQVYASFAACLMNLVAQVRDRGVPVYFGFTMASSVISKARNQLAHTFLKSNYSHLLFIDADMTFRPEDIIRLIEADKEVIAAICPKKDINWDAVTAFARAHPDASPEAVKQAGACYGTFEFLNDEPVNVNEPVEVAMIGTGIMLIKRAAFERLRAAPNHKVVTLGADEGEEIFFDNEFADGLYFLEDVTFCRRFRAAGGRVWGAPWFRVGHIGNHEFVGDLSAAANT